MNPQDRAMLGETAIDGTLAKATVRLVGAGLGALALLPPLAWGIALTALERVGPDLEAPWASSVAWVAIVSMATAAALWALVFERPMRALRQAERRLRVFAKRDVLTGLPNRDALRMALERSLARRRGTELTVGILVIDMDRFRIVNDSLGPAAGDELLRSVAGRIRAVVCSGDVVARLGADQFAVLVDGVSEPAALASMARNVQRGAEPAHSVFGHQTVTTLSIGFAVAAEHADGADALLNNAEVAMRAAKAEGGARSRGFDAALRVDDSNRLELEGRLRNALRAGEFVLMYQPIVDASSKRIVATEALLRWADPTRGLVSPAEFIPVLEETGLIVGVGTWVLREACRQGVHWNGDATAPLVLSVNVSPRQFAQNDFVDTVRRVLAETRFPPKRLQLEVTEGLLLDPTPEMLRKIAGLVATGVRLAIDDFGMGYSSLAYLKTFPLHTLKIDRMFVRDVALQERDTAIARAIVDLGHGLGLRITAEGVETEAQSEVLRELGCDSLQGYLFSRPVAAAAMQVLLAQQAGAPGAAAPAADVSARQAEGLTAL